MTLAAFAGFPRNTGWWSIKDEEVIMTERQIRMELSDLQLMLLESGKIEPDEALNDAHIEPGELVIRVLKEE
jgi:hypothetical protein